jgi:pentatricopeptide repeat protein
MKILRIQRWNRVYQRFSSIMSLHQTESILDACVEKNDIVGSLSQYNSLITNGKRPTEGMMIRLLELAVNNSSIDAAETIWDSYQFMGYQPSIDLYYLMMKTYVSQKNMPLALKMFKDLNRLGIEPDIRMYNVALEALADTATPKEMERFYAEICSKNIEMNEETFSILMEYHNRKRQLERSLFWFDLMKGTATNLGSIPKPLKVIEPTDLTHIKLFKAYIGDRTWLQGMVFLKRLIDADKAKQSLYEEGIKQTALWLRVHDTLLLLDLAHKNHIPLSSSTYMHIPRMYYRLGDYENGNDWVEKIGFMGHEIEPPVFSSMVRALLKNRQYVDAYHITKGRIEGQKKLNLSIIVDMIAALCDIKYLLSENRFNVGLNAEEIEDMLNALWDVYQPFRNTYFARPIRIYKHLLDHYTSTNQIDKAETIMNALLDDHLLPPIVPGLQYGKLLVKTKGWHSLFSMWSDHTKRKMLSEMEKRMISSSGIRNLKTLTLDMFSSYAKGYPIRLQDPRRELFLVNIQFATSLLLFQETIPGATQREIIKRDTLNPVLNWNLLTRKSLWEIWTEVAASKFEYKNEFAGILVRACEQRQMFGTKGKILADLKYQSKISRRNSASH